MAMRRNAPSNDALRVITANFNRALKGSSDIISSQPLLLEGYFRCTNPYSGTNSSHRTWPPGSAIPRPGALPQIYSSTATSNTHSKSKSLVRAISTSRSSSSTAPAEPPIRACVPFHLEDLKLDHPVRLPFPQSSSSGSTVTEQSQNKEKDGTETKPRIYEERTTSKRLEDDAALVDVNQNPKSVVLIGLPYLAPEEEEIPVLVSYDTGRRIKMINGNRDRRHNYLYNYILLARDRCGDDVASRIAVETLKCYVKTKLDQDWQLAKQLYISLCYRFMPADLRAIRNLLVRSMLGEDPPRLEAVSLLMEKVESDRETTPRRIISYLEDFCDKQPDMDLHLAEADKILRSVREFPELGTTQLLIPLVRYAVTKNDPDHARNLVNRLSQEYELSPDFGVLSEITKGYARQGNMSAIDELLSELHHQGFSRSKPYAFAALIKSVFYFLIPVRKAGRMFDFLTYAVQNHGLVPSTSLSVTVAKSFIAARRYDLLQKWVKSQQTWFPDILNLAKRPLAAYEINDTWSHGGASTLDSLYTCKALAYGTLRNPFSEEFRHMTNSWLSSLLFQSSKELVKQIGVDKQHVGFKRFSNLEAMFEFSRRLIEFASQTGLDTRKSLFVDTFRKKIEAAQETEFLVNRFSQYVQQYGPVLDFGEQHFLQQKLSKKQALTFTAPSEIQKMTRHKLAKTMLENYRNARPDRGHDQRSTVVNTVRYLERAQRHRDCVILVQEFWNSGCVTGAFFTHEIIKNWVMMAYELREPKLLHEALWAAIDSEPAHVIGYKFLMLIRAAAAVVTEQIDLGYKQQYPNQLHELNYLISRCYRRRWQQDGCPSVEDIADPFLKRWKEEQDKQEKSAFPFQRRYDYIL